MSSVLQAYSIMQQSEWAGRKFYTAQDQKGQVVYLVAEPVEAPPYALRHPALPHVQQLTVEESTRWLIGQIPQGQVLEDLRNQGVLTEKDVANALTGVIDALTLLSTCEPPLVPAYLDPACIKKDWLGRWILDHLALAHAPESRSSIAKPLGVYPFGALLYWLLTGQSARMTRIQITKVPPGTSAALQFILIRCLGRSYTSLAELRADVERAGQEREFATLIRSVNNEEKPVTSIPALNSDSPPVIPAQEEAPAPQPPQATGPVATPAETVSPMAPRQATLLARLSGGAPVSPPQEVPAVSPPVNVSPVTPRQEAAPVTRLPEVAPVTQSPEQASGVRLSEVEPPTRSPEAAPGTRIQQAARVAQLQEAVPVTRPLAVPAIPVNDRPWALPTRPPEGFRKQYMPPMPNPVRERRARFVFKLLSGTVTLALMGLAALKFGLIPPKYLPDSLPWYLQALPAVTAYPRIGGAEAAVPPDPKVPVEVSEPKTGAMDAYRKLVNDGKAPAPVVAPPPTSAKAPQPAPAPGKSPAVPSGKPAPSQPSAPGNSQQTQPPAQNKPPTQPTPPAPPGQPPAQSSEPAKPQLGTVDYWDRETGAMPILIHVGGNSVRYAYVFPHPVNPYISLETFNSLFGKTVLWMPNDAAIRLLDGGSTILTRDFLTIQDRIWLKLTPALQADLGVKLDAFSSSGLFFTVVKK